MGKVRCNRYKLCEGRCIHHSLHEEEENCTLTDCDKSDSKCVHEKTNDIPVKRAGYLL